LNTDYEHLIYEQRGPVTVITINRSHRMNAQVVRRQRHRTSHRREIDLARDTAGNQVNRLPQLPVNRRRPTEAGV
jgi:hypothetical protein